MRQEIKVYNSVDKDGHPTGGAVHGLGIRIVWQDGQLGRGEDRIEPNGAFVEGVIEAAIKRLEFYQGSKFNCPENAAALDHLEQAMDCLESRTNRREDQGVEGTHQGK